MGANIGKQSDLKNSKVNLDNISTVSMALEIQPPKPKLVSSSGPTELFQGMRSGNGQNQQSINRVPLTPTSVRFTPSGATGVVGGGGVVRNINLRNGSRNSNTNNNYYNNQNNINNNNNNNNNSYSHETNPDEDHNNNQIGKKGSSKFDLDNNSTSKKGSSNFGSSSTTNNIELAEVNRKINEFKSLYPPDSSKYPNNNTGSLNSGINKCPTDSQQFRHPKEAAMDCGQNAIKKRSVKLSLVFALELLSLAGLAVFAHFLHFTEEFSVVERKVDCNDESIRQDRNISTNSLLFADVSRNAIYLGNYFIPFALIIIFEIVRKLVGHSEVTSIFIQRIRFIASIYKRRTLRIIGGFSFGFLLTSVVVDLLKHQTGQKRPYFLTLCDPCQGNSSCPLVVPSIREASMSFPSSVAAITSYSAVFLIFYLSYSVQYRMFRFVRLWMVLGSVLAALLISATQVITNQNHPWDVIVGLLIGLFFALYIVFIHLNVFADQISVTNFFSSNIGNYKSSFGNSNNNDQSLFQPTDEWFSKSYHIPRVQTVSTFRNNNNNNHRNSHLWNSSEREYRPRADNADIGVSLASIGHHSSDNAYVNPAFSCQDDSILANHIHHDDGLNSHSSHNLANHQQQQIYDNRVRTFHTFQSEA